MNATEFTSRRKFASLFEIRWLDTQFQLAVVHESNGVAQRSVVNDELLTRQKNNPDWQVLVKGGLDDELDVEGDADLQVLEDYEAFDSGVLLPTSFEEIEAIENLRFEPGREIEEPGALFEHQDGSTRTRLRPEYSHVFEHSATSSFFAYLPVYFWRQVLFETKKYAVTYGIRISRPFTLIELMSFLGILFYMALNKKGEYANYWGSQPEDLVFGGSSTSLDTIMSLSRFKVLRRCFSFNAVPTTLVYDAAARIRPLLNLLKVTGGLYVDVGRNVALNEASVVCRSRQGRHMIVFNPMKPTGKYHFRHYVVCCSSTWIALNYKLHCSRCDVADRWDGIVGFEEDWALSEEFDQVSKIRQHVQEVMRPFYATNRIVNMDNYYTSVQLLQELELKGLYGRGTIRANSKHFPRHTMLDESKCSCGDSLQAISIDYSMNAASWCDGDVVNMLTNADPSTTSTVTRMIGSETREYPVPTCLGEYNNNMQGVERLDTIRATPLHYMPMGRAIPYRVDDLLSHPWSMSMSRSSQSRPHRMDVSARFVDLLGQIPPLLLAQKVIYGKRCDSEGVHAWSAKKASVTTAAATVTSTTASDTTVSTGLASAFTTDRPSVARQIRFNSTACTISSIPEPANSPTSLADYFATWLAIATTTPPVDAITSIAASAASSTTAPTDRPTCRATDRSTRASS
ncbi:unnamed protein product [Phytophthora fragariaefolia]|uniref:Unnamed protein product n=1 Tax=Phytophthora fragariaefolia TaxID=1490495 RepID=A0A9W6XTI2_9STRA|nr:unnamed protein product [Phytophthora fragariaefolia]